MDNKIIKKDSLSQLERQKKINKALFKISNAVSLSTTLYELYGFSHNALSPVIDVTNFFIAIYDNKNDSISFPYCVDAIDGILSPVEGIKSTASLTAEVIRTEKSIQIENYIQKHSGAQFSHGVCPECCDELYGNKEWYIEIKKEENQQ